MSTVPKSLLKDLPLKLQSASVKDRVELLNSIKNALETDSKSEDENSVPAELAAKSLAKVLPLVLPRYSDNKSRWAVIQLVQTLLDRYAEATFKVFCASLQEALSAWKNIVPSLSLVKTALFALQWTSVLITSAWKKDLFSGAEAKKVLETQSWIISVLQGLPKLPKRFEAKIKLISNPILSDAKLVDQVSKIFNLLDPSLNSMALGASLMSKLDLKSMLSDQLVKLVISNKAKTPSHSLLALRPYLKTITHEDFKGLMPPMLKAMLRNPELVMESFSLILGNLSIDLSQYVKELSPSFATQLQAKDDATRDMAIACVSSLALKVSDSEALEVLLKAIFDVLIGAKLTVASHKMSLLSATASLADNSVLSKGPLAMKASQYMIKILSSEVHEGTLIHALDSLQTWFKHIREFPSEFVDWIPKGLALKSITSGVRSAYLSCLLEALMNVTAKPHQDIHKSIVKITENAARQPSQVAIVSEAIHASACFVKLRPEEVENPSNEVTKLILGDLLTSERILSGASGSALKSLCVVAEKVILHHPDNNNDRWLKALTVALTHNEGQTRSMAASVIKKVGNVLGGQETLKNITLQLKEYLWTSLNVELENFDDNLKIGSVTYALNALVKAVTDGARDMAEYLVPICHHPAILASDNQIWMRMCQKLKVDPSELIQARHEDLIQKALDDVKHSGPYAVEGFSKINPDAVVPLIISKLSEAVNKADLKISLTDFQVYKTPEDQVYDRSSIDNCSDSNDIKNVKRENKAYSHKEQLEEIEIRKELEAKRRGKREMTPKQKEAFKVQLEKEAVIRDKLTATHNELSPLLVILKASVKGQPKAFASFIGQRAFLPMIYKVMQCPLFQDIMDETFLLLRNAVFENEDETMSQTILASTILIVRENNKNKALLKVVLDLIYTSTCGDPNVACPFTTSGFNLAFKAIKEAIWNLKEDQDYLNKGLMIINEHSGLEGDGDEESSTLLDLDELHPKYLPRKEMLRLLIDLLAFNGSQSAVSALISVCVCCSGKPGLARADDEELQILFSALKHESQVVRDAALRGLDALDMALDESNQLLIQRLWVAKYDPIPENQILADALWDKLDLTFPSDGLYQDIIHDVVYPVSASLRTAGAMALSKCPDLDVSWTLDKILDLYDDKLETTPPLMDGLGRVIQESIDHWEPREGLAISLQNLASSLEEEQVEKATNFLVKEGLIDRKDIVRKRMLKAAMAIVDIHGKTTASDLLPVFEDFLDNAPKEQKYDDARQSVVILMGSLAKHLDPSDPKVRPIMRQLILALNTPSQQVQEAVANCLPPLVPTIKEEAPEIVGNLISTLLGGAEIRYGERRGAAYGLAGFVKGLGILSLKQLDIMGKLTNAVTDKKSPKAREGALFAFEMLCTMLGRLFEPYIVHILPHLLLCFGDPVDHVREAADDCAKAVMSKLSAHGVKLVLPALLNALEEDQWRTKTGSVELLGAMAFCAPKQLSSCLPSIVPKLIEVLGDSHHKVQKAGAQALKQIGSVIRNPEIQAIVPQLLRALQDPSAKTGECLQTLLDTKFVHFIDAPSLALIMPVVQRAFKDRSTETRKMAAQIIGNMYSLTDQKDLSPYLPGILPGLKSSLLDPVPEVRTVSARALGAMVKGMGESSFEELLPWLMATLTSESSSVDRSGAAQGLAEVVGGLGIEKMHELMPDIIRTAERSDIAPHVKDGYIMMFIFMPSVFPEAFTEYIGQIISPILRALADENEFVRDTAYKAGQRIVLAYADTAVELLLPELELGLFDENWRIRHSSVQLLGDLLYKISGVSGKMTTATDDADDTFGTESSQKAVVRVLGPERYHRVLAGLYMGRSDVALMVRQAALHVWKVVVSNTPKTLREVLPTLFNLLLGCLASNSYDKRQVAARTLGDLVKKLGERVLPEIIPILERGLKSDAPEKRQGVCVGLSEIMSSTSRDMVLTFVNSLVPTVRRALCDPTPEVRAAAAKTFDSLHNTVGSRALDDILPPMLEEMTENSTKEDEASKTIYENTLDGLRQVMAIKARAVLPYLVPQLIAAPVNTRALASLAPVSGEALHRHLPKILPALINALSNCDTNPQELEFAEAVVLSVSDDDSEVGVSCIMEELLSAANFKRDENNRPKGDPGTLSKQRSAITLLASFCRDTKCDFSQYVAQLIRILILLFTSKDSVVLSQAWNALNSVTKTLDTADQMAHVPDVRQAVRFAVADLKYAESPDLMPGFCLPKGITPILPIFRESILNGPPELKETAANGLGEVIKLTSADALKPSVVHITGPLIRILGDRFGANVKTAVLDTLACLLGKAGVLLKPFFPQLQTTFVKALNDPNRTVRLKAGIALSFLIDIHMRPDPLFNELANGIKNADEASVRDTYLQALRGCIEPSGSKMSAPIRRQILPLLLNLIQHPDDTSRSAAAGCLGAFCKWLPDDDLNNVIEDVLVNSEGEWQIKHGKSAVLYVALKDAPERICGPMAKIVSTIKGYVTSDVVALAQNGVRATGYLYLHLLRNNEELPVDLISPFCRAMNHQSNDVKQMVSIVSQFWAKQIGNELLPIELLKPLLPTLVNGTKEKNSTVKSFSETALVAVLHLRQKEDSSKKSADCLQILPGGARDSLQEVITKVLQRVANQPEGKEEVIDDTLVTI